MSSITGVMPAIRGGVRKSATWSIVLSVLMIVSGILALAVNAKHVVHSGDSGNNGGSHTNPLPLEGLPNEVSS
jgi:hypothetical protein